MKIIVSNKLLITNPTDAVKRWCATQLQVRNPEYVRRKRMGLWLGRTPEFLCLYEEAAPNLIYTPFGCLRSLLDLVGDGDSVTTHFAKAEPVNYGASVPLYDYQSDAVARLIEAQYGILQSPAGSGKTQIGIALAAAIGRKTLWLTHTHDLLEQSLERAARYINPALFGTITEGKVQIGAGITFATVQTMCRLRLEDYRDVWDTIIVDECHRVSGTPTALSQFSTVLNALSARHKYGLSATVHRADGMIAATFAILGDIVCEIPEAAVAGKILKVSVLPRYTHIQPDLREAYNPDGTMSYTKLINYLSENTYRNGLIISDLIQNAEHSNLILSDRLSQLEYLMRHLPEDLQGLAVAVDGKKPKAVREKALAQMRSGDKRFLFATYALAKEGLDIPRLDRLYLATPQKDYAIVAQSIGRIARVFDGKGEPIVYDYVDDRSRYLLASFKKRCTIYNKLGCKQMEDGNEK